MIWNKGLTKETSKKVNQIAKRNSFLFKNEPERFLERNRKISEKRKGKSPWNKGKKLGKQTSEHIEKRAIYSRKPRSFLKYYMKKYPLLFKVNDIRENDKKEIEVRCKTCNNFFVVERSSLHERIRAIEGKAFYAENNLYCSDECKLSCSIYRKRTGGIIEKKSYTNEEYQTFRTFVLERDNYECQFCGKKATDVHHERPQKLEPFFALDPDFAWSCCKKCHYKYGHKDECSTGNLSSKIC
jgi:hypothetical protein